MKKLSEDYIKFKIIEIRYLVDRNITTCVITMENGYEVVGFSACVHSEIFDLDTGKQLAYQDAFRNIWPLEGYLLAQKRFEESKT